MENALERTSLHFGAGSKTGSSFGTNRHGVVRNNTINVLIRMNYNGRSIFVRSIGNLIYLGTGYFVDVICAPQY